jgi:hypothetical protein
MLRTQQSQTLSITPSTETLAGIRRSIHACEHCSENAVVPFAQLLERLRGRLPANLNEELPGELQCPSCMGAIGADSCVEVQVPAKAFAARACA